jgi:UDP-glucose 4-epimerase
LEIDLSKRIALLGGAGFLGLHLLEALEKIRDVSSIVVVDKFVHELPVRDIMHNEDKTEIVKLNIKETGALKNILETRKVDTVIHLAANADISASAFDPSLDFFEGTLLTQSALEASRIAKVEKFIFTSGSGVYGDNPEQIFSESSNFGFAPSPYAASKQASESLLQAYHSLTGIKARVFRMGNIVGPWQTHGVGIDLLRKLWRNPLCLNVLGNGYQKKPYIHVRDVVDGILRFGILEETGSGYDVFNLATDGGTYVYQIANWVIELVESRDATIEYGQSPFGWPGDVPIIQMSSGRAISLGWKPKYTSDQAVYESLREMVGQKQSYGF